MTYPGVPYRLAFGLLLALAEPGFAQSEKRPAPATGAVANESTAYYLWPDAVFALDPTRHYRAVFNASKAANKPADLGPAVQRVARYYNGFAAHKVPLSHVDFVMVFHGPGADAVLADGAYKAKYGIENPNRVVIERLQRLGVRFLICGQYVASANISRTDILRGVEISEAAMLVLITLGNKGFAVIGE